MIFRFSLSFIISIIIIITVKTEKNVAVIDSNKYSGEYPADVMFVSSRDSSASRCIAIPTMNKSIEDKQNIFIFYGATIIGYPFITHGYGIAYAQLQSLASVGLLHTGNVHIFISHAPESPMVARTNVSNETQGMTPSKAIRELRNLSYCLSNGTAKFTFSGHKNEYEYPALNALYSYSLSANESGIALYFHNKGASHISDRSGASLMSSFRKNLIHHGFGRRTLSEMTLFREVVSSWRQIVLLFNTYSEIKHLGIAPASRGFQWFNFWWSRLGYIATRRQPRKPEEVDRHYYEGWLAERDTRTKAGVGGCSVSYSLAQCAPAVCGQAKWAEASLRRLRKKMFFQLTSRASN